jgi:hypothetical protein
VTGVVEQPEKKLVNIELPKNRHLCLAERFVLCLKGDIMTYRFLIGGFYPFQCRFFEKYPLNPLAISLLVWYFNGTGRKVRVCYAKKHGKDFYETRVYAQASIISLPSADRETFDHSRPGALCLCIYKTIAAAQPTLIAVISLAPRMD